MLQITDNDLEQIVLAAEANGKSWRVDEVLRVYFQILIDGRNWPAGEAGRTAVIILPGQQDYRVTRVLQDVWPVHGRYLWAAGTRGDPLIEREDIIGRIKASKKYAKISDLIECQGWADNTPDQMRWVIRMVKKYTDVKHLIVTTSAYHLPRCVLTLVKEMKTEDIVLPVTPWPLSSFSGNSFSKLRSNQNLVLEIAKTLKYQQSGHVASLEEWDEYFKNVIKI